ncbi:uncharacterized protein E0L32_008434 [Thyridium curvatum]|uniref:EamA domain-containing protein n=1 Tax=Thyridium curvatum TaxID=1093900 RepID=A0A507B0Q0_9PEZI|nr:uncharacterized protein E0L32_008434 [Thyridium curvatum]TPX10548.1 hypothetical protein E0L32_008434 [Thyridium curvatum]
MESIALGKPTDGLKADSERLDVDSIRRMSSSPFSYGDHEPSSAVPFGAPITAPSTRIQRAKKAIGDLRRRFWAKNKPVVLVATAQLFAALMNVAARLLEHDSGNKMHPMQLLFARHSMTMIGACVYMYWKNTPHFPFGAREVRWLLVARGITGFFGIFGMWYSMLYLPLAEATVITFLVPSVSGYICHVLLHEPFTRKEQIGSYIALAGVVLIARPTSLFSSSSGNGSTPPEIAPGIPANGTDPYSSPGGEMEATPLQRLGAIGISLVGVLGAALAFTTIRSIGKRAHPLISVNYFSTWSTLVCIVALTLGPILDIDQPGMQFGLPNSLWQWTLCAFLGVTGFCMQFLLTAGLGSERSNRATAMVYTHMLFAAAFDKWIFGHEMGVISVIGCGMIVGSALWVALSKKAPVVQDSPAVAEAGQIGMERVPMLADTDDEEEEQDEDESDGEDETRPIPLEVIQR